MHDQGMHLRTDRLRVHAAAAAELAAALAALGRAPGTAAERVDAAMLTAQRELAEIEAALQSAAIGAEDADHAASAAFQRAMAGP
jgi:hypothetical protein